MELGEGTERKGEGEKKSRMAPRSGFWLAEEEESGKEKSQICFWNTPGLGHTLHGLGAPRRLLLPV